MCFEKCNIFDFWLYKIFIALYNGNRMILEVLYGDHQ